MIKNLYYAYFQEKLLPIILPMEEYRKKTVRNVIISSVFMFGLGILFAYIYIYISLKYDKAVILLPFMLFFMYVFFIKSIINVILTGKKYQNWLVENVLPLFFEPIANFKQWPKNNDIEAVIDSKLFINFDTQEDEASIFGVYKNANIIISNTRLTLPVKGAIKQNLFKGTLIQIELEKSINNHIILMSKNSYKANKYKQINPKIKELNNYLYMFAKNGENTDIINQEFWDLIRRFGRLFVAKSFKFSYNNNVILIALDQKRPWQFGFLFKSLLKPNNFDDLIERFVVIYDLIDYVKSKQSC